MGSLLEKVVGYVQRNALTASAIGIFGLVSVWATHVAGFFLMMPRSLWPFFDSSFFASFLSQFSLIVAASLALGRYSPYLLASLVSFLLQIALASKVASSKRRQRVVRRYASALIRKEFGGGIRPNLLRRMSEGQPFLVGILGLSGRIAGIVEISVERYEFVIQSASVVILVSLFYLPLWSVPFLFAIVFALIMVLPPSILQEYFEAWMYGGKEGFFDFIMSRPERYLTIKKLALIVLTASLLSGALRFIFVSEGNDVVIRTNSNVEIRARILAKTGTGVIVSDLSGSVSFLNDVQYSEVAPFSN